MIGCYRHDRFYLPTLCLFRPHFGRKQRMLLHLNIYYVTSSVRVQPGHSTALQCFTPDDGHFKVFWLKFQNSSAPDFVALAESDKTGIMIGEKFQDPSKFRLTWNQLSFNLSVLNIEQRDIAVYYCAFAVDVFLYVSQPDSAVRVQPGHSTALQCVTPDDGHFKEFWLKLQNSSAPVLVALADSDKTGIMIGEKFQDPSKFRLTWNQLSFDLSVLNIEQTDIAVYYCGIIIYNRCEKKYFANSLSVIILLLSNIALCIVTYYNMKWLALIHFEIVFTQKLLVNFTNNYRKEPRFY
uniref:Ig-like domain-containing protein n=1 Tax=Sinocyclocheilus rhinocerous TaxID=307959 RepID=A0A673N0L8_9TELE